MPGDGAGERRALAGRQQRNREQGGRQRTAHHGFDQPVGVGNVGDLAVTAAVEGTGGQNHDGGVDQQRQRQAHHGVQRGKAHRFTPAFRGGMHTARLHNGRVQVQVVRHHGGAHNADGQVQRARLLQPFQAGHKAHRHAKPVRLRHGQLHHKTAANRQHQAQHNCLDPAKACALQAQHQHRVKGSDGDAHRNRHAEQQMQRQRTAQHLGQITGDDGDFSAYP